MSVTTSMGTGGPAPANGAGGRLVAADGRELILRSATLRVDAGGGIARAVLAQRFVNPFDEPLRLAYQLPLPADGAVAGYAFEVGERRITGEVDRREAARERFEEALLEGRTAALLEQERPDFFTQEIGNVPPRTEVVAHITVDQKLRWLAEGAWEWRFPTVIGARYAGAAGRIPDAARVVVEVLDGAPPARAELEANVRDALADGTEPGSPSHAVRVRRNEDAYAVQLADDRGTSLDRDLVLRWRVAAGALAARLALVRPADERTRGRAFGLLTLVPPAATARPAPIARDLIVLIDASGSMSGAPLAQARGIAQALVGSLGARDSLELIAFASAPERFRARAERASEGLKAAAHAWLEKLQAGGATEMDDALAAALAPLRADAQRHVVLVTDGLIGFESEIVARLLASLPTGSRLHTVGVGSAPNRTLTAGAARAGRGIEVLVGLDEDAAVAAQRLLAHVGAPLVAQIALGGSALRAHAPERLRDLAAGAPLLVALELDPAGGDVEVRAEGFAQRIPVAPIPLGAGSPALAALFARERVEDLEMRAAAGETCDEEIERLGLAFQIATRRTAWVAVDAEASADPRDPTRRVRVPQAVPFGTSVEGIGLRTELLEWVTLGLSSKTLDEPLVTRLGVTRPSRPLLDRLRALPRLLRRAPATSRLRGSIALARETELVLELAREREEIRWSPGATARVFVQGRDGLELEVSARVDLARSSRAVHAATGQVLRLALRFDAPLPGAPVRVELESGGETLVIELEP